jgi:DNA-binding MarR family transcriptional regulator
MNPAVTSGDPALVDALVALSRVLVGQTARAIGAVGADLSLPQYRTLVVLASRGPLRTRDLADELGVQPSTVTRKIDRLLRKGLVWRKQGPPDRRVAWLGLTEDGKELVGATMRRRRDAIQQLVASVHLRESMSVADAVGALATAGGELPDPQWWTMWSLSAALMPRPDAEQGPGPSLSP